MDGLLINQCVFHECSASLGGGWFGYASRATVVNTIFYGNFAATSGGGSYNWARPSPTFQNCTFAHNVASTSGGAIYSRPYIYSFCPTVTNCILWGNSSEIGGRGETSQCTHNLISLPDISTFPSSNISGDPLFKDVALPAGPDGIFGTIDDGLCLQPESPCVDAGLEEGAPETDQRGYRRDDAPDIGAYEVGGRRPYNVRFDVDGAGWLSGDVRQTVYEGADSTPVTAFASPTHSFFAWSDGSRDNPIVLQNVTEDAVITAIILPPLGYLNRILDGDVSGAEATVELLMDAGTEGVVNTRVAGYRLALQDIGYIDNAEILQQIIDAVNQEHGVLKIYVRDGWNLISSPFAGWSPSNVFLRNQILSVQGYRRGSYYTMPSAAAWVPGAGYWLQLGSLAQDETPIIISGQVMNDTTIPVTDGWNLIGPIVDTPTETMDYVAGHPMAWDAENGQYVSAGDILHPGTGYWGRIDSAAAYVGRPEITAVVFDHDAETVSIEVGSLNADTVRIRVCDAASGSTAVDVLSQVASGVGTVALGTEQGLEVVPRHIYTIEVSAVRNGIRGDWVGGRYFSGAGGTEAAEAFVNTDLMAAGFDWETLTFTDLDTGGAAVEYTAIVLDAAGLPTAVQESRTVPDADSALDLDGVTVGSGDTLYIKVRLVDSATGAPKTDWRTFPR